MPSKNYMRAYRERNRARIRVKRRAWAENNRDRERAAAAKHRANNPQKIRARKIVELARRKGMKSPGKCPHCGAKVGKGRDGRTMAQVHHPDHSNPARVAWRCPKCHKGL